MRPTHVLACLLLASCLHAQQKAGIEWRTYGGNSKGWRFSGLSEIDAANVSKLRPEWIFQTNVPGRIEATPLVIDGVMYITAASNNAFALDLRSGRKIWQYSQTPPQPVNTCCGEVNRGFASWKDKLFKVNIEDTLVALDRNTGKVVWETQLEDFRRGYSGTLAPLVVKDKVLVGTAGAEFGTRGFIDAYDAETGKKLWRFYTIPASGEPEAATWKSDNNKDTLLRGGGSTWNTGTYDPELNLLYWGTGNPGPDLNGDRRPGDNLYTCSLLALDPDTGALKWHFQFTPHDTHDWDAVADPVLVDLTIGGRKVKAVIQANRNGYFYALDRTNGKFLFARAYTTVTWTDGIDPQGRPKPKPGQEPTRNGNKICPALAGGHNWEPTAYDPQTRLYYFGSTDGCQIFYNIDYEFIEGEWYQLSSTEGLPNDPLKGSVIALDPSTGEIRWRFAMVRRPSGGALVTAGGLLFIGDYYGNLIAFDARTGKVLWRFKTGGSIFGAPISYSFNHTQHIAVASGGIVMSFALP